MCHKAGIVSNNPLNPHELAHATTSNLNLFMQNSLSQKRNFKATIEFLLT